MTTTPTTLTYEFLNMETSQVDDKFVITKTK